MKLVTAIVQPHKFDEVKAALTSAGIHGMTVSEANGYGHQHGHTEVYRGVQYLVDLTPKVRIEILTEDDQVEHIAQIITQAAFTGKMGDGKIWVVPIESVIRVRTGETGVAALQHAQLSP